MFWSPPTLVTKIGLSLNDTRRLRVIAMRCSNVAEWHKRAERKMKASSPMGRSTGKKKTTMTGTPRPGVE